MKKLSIKSAIAVVAPVAVLTVAALTTHAQVISWNDNNGYTIPATGVAGMVAVTNWNNSNPGNGGSLSAMLDNSNATTTAGFTITGTYGGWGIGGATGPDADGTYNKLMLGGYANTSSGVSGGQEVFSITGIPYYRYNLVAYFSSDATNRGGTIGCPGAGVTNDFVTIGPSSVSGANAVLIQTTDTTGANPVANYAVFTNLSGASQSLILNITNGGGMAGFQIVSTINIPLLSLANDTTVSPSTNIYIGSTVVFTASFGGTLPITNQWEVDSGSGFVPIAGATNTTLTLTNLQFANAGSYALFVSNAAGSSNSTPVALNIMTFPTNGLAIDVQFTGSGFGSGNAPTQTGAAYIGNSTDVWNTVSNPNASATVAGSARGTNLVLFDTGNITTPITMDYVADYLFNGTAFGDSNPFVLVGSPYGPLMSGYMGSVTTTTPDTNTITLRHLVPGTYDLYLYVCGRSSDGQNRVDELFANDQNAVCGPNNGNATLIAGVNYVHLTPTVTTNGVLNIGFYGTTDNGQGLLNSFQLYGPSTNASLSLSSDTTCDSPLNDYVGRTVKFSATFAGIPTPALQWEVNKGSGFMPITGATNSSLVLANVQTTDSGSYELLATNAAGNLNSTPLTLNVQSLPSPLAIDVQFIGTSMGSGDAGTQVGPAVIGGGSDFWNPVSNPNPVGGDTNRISGSGLLLSDVNNYGTALTLDYLADRDFNNSGNTPFNGSGSPAANLMQASLVTLNSNAGAAAIHGLPSGVYDLYLYSCAANNQQGVVTRFAANDSYDNCGPNTNNSTLMLETNYVHLTPTVTANGLINISFAGAGGAQGNLNGIQISGPGATVAAPAANFSGSPTQVYMTQPVAFADASAGNITNWLWNFGDANTLSTNASAIVTHAYAVAGTYTVTLIVNGPGGSSTNSQVNYVVVNPKPTIDSPVLLSGGSLVLSGGGGFAGTQYRILSSTNVALSLVNWTPVWTNVFAPDGSYSYTNVTLTNSADFFRLITP